MGSGTVSTQREHTYIAIDLKSFYASVECVARGLDPLTTHLVVADETRTDKTICLAVSPSLKNYGIPGRARLFEVKQRLNGVNIERTVHAPGGRLIGESCDACDLERSPGLKASMVIAKPRMAHYLEISGQIYGIYLKYAAPEHIHVYSIDEVFIDATPYLRSLGMGPHAMARTIVREILTKTGITATAGIGSNMYLAKVAMDIVAKHMPADKDGVRVAELNEMSYRRLLWDHRPLTDFWRVGRGYAKKLEHAGLMTMGDIARCSVGRASDYYNEDLLYRMFGVNAELLIDHSWGRETATIADIKNYRPRIYIRYSSVYGPFIVPRYEDRPLQEGIKAQITSLGGVVLDAPGDSDCMLAVNSPGKHMIESVEQYTKDLTFSTHLNLNELFRYMRYYHEEYGRPVGLAEVSVANGCENDCMELGLLTGTYDYLTAVGGWNTAQNTIGVVLAQLVIASYYNGFCGRPEQLRRSEEFMASRLASDWLYQSNVLHRYLAETAGTVDPYALGRHYGDAAEYFRHGLQALLDEKFTAGIRGRRPIVDTLQFQWDGIFYIRLHVRLEEVLRAEGTK